MRIIIQRVKEANVSIENNKVGSIGPGFLVFLAIHKKDSELEVAYMVKKIIKLRIFSDTKNKMNLDISAINGEMLVVSQFTLYANTGKGNRPSFIDSASPDKAKRLYELFIENIKLEGVKVATGVFGEYMQVELVNDGPVTIIMDS